MAVLDSYSESNYTSQTPIYGTTTACGQSIQLSASAFVSSAKFYLGKSNSPSGVVTVRIYASTGTHGTDAKPTGDFLLESNPVDLSSIPDYTTPGLVEFTFSDTIVLSGGTCYILVVYCDDSDTSNRLMVGFDATGSTHEGNRSTLVSGVWGSLTSDYCFYLYGEASGATLSIVDSTTVVESVSGYAELPGCTLVDTLGITEAVECEVIKVYEVGVNDEVTTAENVEAVQTMEIVDAITVSESTGILVENLPIIVSDAVGITEFVDRNAVLLSTVDEVTVSESSVAYVTIPDFVVSVYSGASLSESVAWVKGIPLWTRELPVIYSPFPELEASAVSGAVLDERTPNTSCLGMMGSSVVEKSPLATLEGSISYSVSLSLNAKSPTVEVEGWLGSSLNKKTPSISLEAESYSNFIGLDKRTPVGSLTASMFEEASLSLDGKIPPFTCAGGLYESYMSMEGKIPCAFVSSAVLYYAGMNLDSMTPVIKVVYDSVLAYENGMSLDAMAPVFSMLIDTGAGDTEQAILSYSGRFTDYTLEYSR